MIAILSPAKTLDYSPTPKAFDQTLPVFAKETSKLVSVLRKKSKNKLKVLMSISDNLAEENIKRYQVFEDTFTKKNSKEAIFAFKGDVYRGFDAESLTKAQIKYAQKHVRILSGLYGVLKPLDLMQAYRLEMGTKLSTRKGKNLYEFWDSKITNILNEEIENHKTKTIVNLASNEYFKSVKKKNLNADIIDVSFKEYRGDELKFISFNAKRARGLMARYIVKNKVEDQKGLIGFDLEDYSYSSKGSTKSELLFVR